jgi:uncharacterized protein YbjQ (UPF0145 family)
MEIVTTETIPGKKIVKSLGATEARCSMFVFNEQESAKKNLAKKATELGANAIVGFRYDKRHAYGTAVVVE